MRFTTIACLAAAATALALLGCHRQPASEPAATQVTSEESPSADAEKAKEVELARSIVELTRTQCEYDKPAVGDGPVDEAAYVAVMVECELVMRRLPPRLRGADTLALVTRTVLEETGLNVEQFKQFTDELAKQEGSARFGRIEKEISARVRESMGGAPPPERE